MKIAAKEVDESEYWLLLCKNSKNYPISEVIQNDCKELILILSKIISSAKKSISKLKHFQIDSMDWLNELAQNRDIPLLAAFALGLLTAVSP